MMKLKYLGVLLFIVLSGFVVGQNLTQKSIAITVYNDNLGVVKDLRNVNLKNGISELKITDVAKQIDPTSVHISFDGEVIEQNYQYDLVNLNKILQKYIDKDIELIGEKNEMIKGKLLSVLSGQIVLQKKDGGLLMLPNISKYRFSVGSLPEGLITKPTLLWLINSNSSGNSDVEITYQTSGMNWHAEYVVVLNDDDTKLDVNSWVSVENKSGTTFKNAKLKLVAGDVNRIHSGRGVVPYEMDAVRSEGLMAKQQFKEKEFFEYHIYNLQRPTTLAQNETKQISLFEASNVKAVKKFLYKSGLYNYNDKGKVNVIVEFENKEENGLGVPMPKGKVRVYKSDGESIEFVGEDLVDHTPRNEKIKLKIGDAFDLLAEEKQTENKRISDKVYEQAYEIKLKNRKKENVVIEVDRYLGLNWEILNSTIKYKKKDSQNITFKVPVKKNDVTVLKFKVRYVR